MVQWKVLKTQAPDHVQGQGRITQVCTWQTLEFVGRQIRTMCALPHPITHPAKAPGQQRDPRYQCWERAAEGQFPPPPSWLEVSFFSETSTHSALT